jgi:hypothetical protein
MDFFFLKNPKPNNNNKPCMTQMTGGRTRKVIQTQFAQLFGASILCELVSHGLGLLGRRGNVAALHRETMPAHEFLALVLMDVEAPHGRSGAPARDGLGNAQHSHSKKTNKQKKNQNQKKKN